MNAHRVIVLVLLFSLAACEPFLFSSFPGYVADAVAVANLRGAVAEKNVQWYRFFVLNNYSKEYAFVLAVMYSGERFLYVFPSDLSDMYSFSDPGFGSRHFVSVHNEFVVGQKIFQAPINQASSTASVSNNPWGPDGSGAVLYYGSSPCNVFLSANGLQLETVVYDANWSPSPSSFNILLSGNGGSYDLAATGRLFQTMFSGSSAPATFLTFRNWCGHPLQATLVIFADNMYSDFTPEPLLSANTGRYIVPLGGVTDDAVPAFATNDGIVVRGADGTMRLFGWDGRLQASTRDNGASGRVLIDFSPSDYYYVFDPSSLMLYKARNWWLTR